MHTSLKYVSAQFASAVSLPTVTAPESAHLVSLPDMSLKSITIESSDDTDSCMLSDILLELGALSVTTTDLHRGTSQEQPIYGEPPQETTVVPAPTPATIWVNARITALFPASTDTESLLMTIATNFDLPQAPTLRMHTTSFEDKTPEQWVIQSQQSLKPMRLGRCAIIFPWHKPLPTLCNITLEPGLAFGTGHHATTRLCIQWLQKVIQPNNRILDYGTGSGILAIVAAKLHPGITAVAVDVDADAVRMATENAHRNGVYGRVSVVGGGEGAVGTGYDLVVANILKEPLKQLSDTLVGSLREGGLVGLSGILVRQAEEMRTWYGRMGVVMEDAVVEGEWVLLTGTKVG